MIKKYFYPSLFIFLLFSSCNIINTIHLLKQGETVPVHFKEEIPFEYRAGIIVIKVVVDGKSYDFIFDSGATNAVSLELSEKLKLQPTASQKAVDFEGKSGQIGFATIKNLSIGKINFNNTACAIIDLKKVSEIRCLKVDGLIGANLMRKAIWQIDYENRKIIFADNIDSLHVPANTPFISFTPLLSGTPVFRAEINGMETGKNIFDTGSSGDILLSKTDLDKLIAKDKSLKKIRGTGSHGSGLYGRKQDTTWFAKLPVIKIGGIEAANQIVEFKKIELGNFGSGFFKNYVVTLDWEQNKIYLKKQTTENTNDRKSFGFNPAVSNGKMFISYMYDDSPAQLNGLKLNDQIISINSTDYSTISEDAYCDMITNDYPWKNSDTLNLVIRSANEERKMTLVRKNIFEN